MIGGAYWDIWCSCFYQNASPKVGGGFTFMATSLLASHALRLAGLSIYGKVSETWVNQKEERVGEEGRRS